MGAIFTEIGSFWKNINWSLLVPTLSLFDIWCCPSFISSPPQDGLLDDRQIWQQRATRQMGTADGNDGEIGVLLFNGTGQRFRRSVIKHESAERWQQIYREWNQRYAMIPLIRGRFPHGNWWIMEMLPPSLSTWCLEVPFHCFLLMYYLLFIIRI